MENLTSKKLVELQAHYLKKAGELDSNDNVLALQCLEIAMLMDIASSLRTLVNLLNIPQ